MPFLVGCSKIYLSCRSRSQACYTSVPEAPPTLAWHMCCPSDLKVPSSDPSATIPTSNPALQSRILYLSLSATSQPVTRLLALCTRWARTLAVLGFIGTRTPRLWLLSLYSACYQSIITSRTSGSEPVASAGRCRPFREQLLLPIQTPERAEPYIMCLNFPPAATAQTE